MKTLYLAIILLLFAGTSAHALTISNPTETEKAFYRIYYAGIPLGKIWLWWEADDSYYKVTASIKTSGVVRIFNKQKRLAELTGKRDGMDYDPIFYRAKVTYPHKERSVDMSYQDNVIRDIIVTPEVEKKVSIAQIEQAMDPLSAILHLLFFMAEPSELNEMYSRDVFDGKRLLRGYAYPDYHSSSECLLPCRTYILYHKPVAGYDEEDMQDYKAHGTPLIYLRHNPDISRFPQKLEVTTDLATIEIRREVETDVKN